jgi:hypothetical protein
MDLNKLLLLNFSVPTIESSPPPDKYFPQLPNLLEEKSPEKVQIEETSKTPEKEIVRGEFESMSSNSSNKKLFGSGRRLSYTSSNHNQFAEDFTSEERELQEFKKHLEAESPHCSKQIHDSQKENVPPGSNISRNHAYRQIPLSMEPFADQNLQEEPKIISEPGVPLDLDNFFDKLHMRLHQSLSQILTSNYVNLPGVTTFLREKKYDASRELGDQVDHLQTYLESLLADIPKILRAALTPQKTQEYLERLANRFVHEMKCLRKNKKLMVINVFKDKASPFHNQILIRLCRQICKCPEWFPCFTTGGCQVSCDGFDHLVGYAKKSRIVSSEIIVPVSEHLSHICSCATEHIEALFLDLLNERQTTDNSKLVDMQAKLDQLTAKIKLL